MITYEKKLLEVCKKNIVVLAVLGITIISFLIRFCFKDFISGDMSGCLLPWFDEISKKGFHALENQVGDYNILYQFLIACMTKTGMNPVYGYKLISAFFDYILAIGVGMFVYHNISKTKKSFLCAYMSIILSPIVFLNSSCWGQCDAIYATFAILAIIACVKEKYITMMVLCGISFAFKLQAVFILPFLLLIYFIKQKFSILNFLIIPLTMIIASFPGIIFGRGIFETFRIYLNQTSTYPYIQMNYPSAWCILVNSNLGENETFQSVKSVAILVTIAILIIMFTKWIVEKVDFTVENMIYMSFLICYTCVLFLPTMHERYGFIYEILGIIIFFYYKRTGFALVALLTQTCLIYGNYLFGLGYEINYISSFINIGIYLVYVLMLNKKMKKSEE